jgi:hypothetical protein
MSSLVPLEQLGATVKANLDASEKAGRRSDDMLITAGRNLIEANERIRAARDGMSWDTFLKEHCQIGRSRAYELIAVGQGRTTPEELRLKTLKRVVASQQRKKASAKLADPGRLVVALKAFDRLEPDDRTVFLKRRYLVEARVAA